MIDFVNELRESCLEAFTGIVQGLKGDDDKVVGREYYYQSIPYMYLYIIYSYELKSG